MNILYFIRDVVDAHRHAAVSIAVGVSLLSLVSVLIMELVDLRRKHLERNDWRLQSGVQTTIISTNKTRVVL